MVKIIVEDNIGYDWKITAKKWLVIAGMSAALAAVQALIESMSTMQMPVNSIDTMLVGIAIATLKAIENYLKNK